MRKIAIANQKGGVGKTTTAVNLAAGLSRAGQRTLLIDIDPQANATFAALGYTEPAATTYELLIDDTPLPAVIIPAGSLGVDLIPSDINLAGAEVELISEIGGQMVLRTRLAGLEGYDFVIIDAPPSLGLMTINALATADEIIIPVSVSVFALKGIVQLEKTIEQVRRRLHRTDLRILGILCTMRDNTNVAADVEAAIRERFGDLTFETVIPKNVRLEEAHSRALSIFSHAPGSTGAQAYAQFTEEVIRG